MSNTTKNIILILMLGFGIWLVTIGKGKPKTYDVRYRVDYKESYRDNFNGNTITKFQFQLVPLDKSNKCCKPNDNKNVTYSTYQKYNIGDTVTFTESYCLPGFMIFIGIVLIIFSSILILYKIF